eukprot:gnl/MRDRNA2_/MRDRNA2_152335_c0_seq1.p1 gnl/MRDRNA2_/MRDRNA2_152335_c0~~gnl/MRDRNA2_/MRDRNA2_152335_c0_seq1.p1  ORF type:complete len:123 (+),score=13.31 gnl/MRDRNA2_/MRDRNA2_152335_c0_seq1:225-593(+)
MFWSRSPPSINAVLMHHMAAHQAPHHTIHKGIQANTAVMTFLLVSETVAHRRAGLLKRLSTRSLMSHLPAPFSMPLRERHKSTDPSKAEENDARNRPYPLLSHSGSASLLVRALLVGATLSR